jgi:hypothetical protein
MRFNPTLLASSVLLTTITFNAHATLTDYNANSVNLVYSSISNLTWTKDGNLLDTLENTLGFDKIVNAIINEIPIIYDVPNQFDGSYNNYDGANSRSYSGQYTLSVADFGVKGQTNWWGAMAFVKYLSSINYGGSDQWRLPSIIASSILDPGYAQAGGYSSEFNQLYYRELGKMTYPGTNNSDWGLFNSGFGSLGVTGDVGAFNHAVLSHYWLDTESSIFIGASNSFNTYDGQLRADAKPDPFYVWAVTPGRVATVPVPNSIWLMGTGLVGLLSKAKRLGGFAVRK